MWGSDRQGLFTIIYVYVSGEIKPVGTFLSGRSSAAPALMCYTRSRWWEGTLF